jgi:hypothetical protein
VKEAQALLWDEAQRAQELLRSEDARIAKSNTIKEAFAIPGGLLAKVLDALYPEAVGDEYKALYEKASSVFEEAGWRVYDNVGRLSSQKGREPLRHLSNLMESFPVHSLTGHVLEVLHHALRWCENTSLDFLSPISGKANGVAPEGVLYPHVTLELVPLKGARDVPADWKKPLAGDGRPFKK